MISGTQRLLQHHRTHLQGLGRGLGDPKRLLEASMQRLDHLSSRLDTGLKNWLHRRNAVLNELSAKLSPKTLGRQIKDMQRIVAGMSERLTQTERKILHERNVALRNLAGMLENLSFKRVLDRGYAVIRDGKGDILTSVKNLASGQDIHIQLKDGETAAAIKK
jgi:exodeoxyribonuclease VII large subunit